ELPQNVLLNFFDWALSVDEVIMENLLQRLQRVPRLLLENAIAALRESFVVIGRTVFGERANSGANDLVVVHARLCSALELTGDRLLFVDEQHHNVNGGLSKMNA